MFLPFALEIWILQRLVGSFVLNLANFDLTTFFLGILCTCLVRWARLDVLQISWKANVLVNGRELVGWAFGAAQLHIAALHTILVFATFFAENNIHNVSGGTGNAISDLVFRRKKCLLWIFIFFTDDFNAVLTDFPSEAYPWSLHLLSSFAPFAVVMV